MTNPISGTNVREILAQTVFGAVGTEAMEDLVRVARIEHFKLPTLLSAAGESPTHLRLVISGHVEFVTRHISGSEIVVGHIAAGGGSHGWPYS